MNLNFWRTQIKLKAESIQTIYVQVNILTYPSANGNIEMKRSKVWKLSLENGFRSKDKPMLISCTIAIF